ncbi:rhomboid-like protein [Streptomyces sp. NPDC127117]|uniref:rhomboid-like protein n=1 Tax=Streptomyces sp. NPDC127117 TaxID=3345368 RepID=UPI0036362347
MHQRTDRAVREKTFAAPLLDAIPRQPGPGRPAAPGPAAPSPPRVRAARRWPRLLPTPTGTPFTFGYLLVLVATSLFMEFADPATVAAVLRESSTDVAHLGEAPLLVLAASALWVVGGLTSPVVFVLALVLTALERRIGGWRTAAVFVLGHVVATLATEIPVGLSVVAGHLPESSLHRLDYGISFGLMASVGAVTWLFTPLVRTLVLGGLGVMLAIDLVDLSSPLTDWGHPLALLLGVACRPLLRRAGAVGEAVTRGVAARGEVIRGVVPSRRAPRGTRPPARARGPR